MFLSSCIGNIFHEHFLEDYSILLQNCWEAWVHQPLSYVHILTPSEQVKDEPSKTELKRKKLLVGIIKL